MNKTARYIFISIGIIILGFILWKFKHIIAYILVALVFSVIGKPIVDFLTKLSIRNIRIPKSICALITLFILMASVFAFFRIFVPLLANEAESLSQIDTDEFYENLKEPLAKLENWISNFDIDSASDFSIEDFISEKLTSIFSISMLTNLFGSLASLMGNIFIAFFSISFITYFFLRDEKMFNKSLLLLVPDKHVNSVSHALTSTRRLLMRYFVGILAQITGIITMVTVGLTIVGIGFRHSLVIGLMAGILNVIPYLGPFLGTTFGVILALATNLEVVPFNDLMPLAGYSLMVFVITQITDNVVFQPFIFGSSVNAHPMEIFLVILIAGYTFGIPGMILAIPTYTVIRVFAKEFFNKFKVVKKLTEKIE